MAVVEIEAWTPHHSDPRRVKGAWIDYPRAGSQADVYAIEVSGWAVGRSSPIVAVSIVHEEVDLRSTPIRVLRPDVVEARPEMAGAEKCGFWTAVGTLGLRPQFELRIDGIFADGSRESLALIRGRYEPPKPSRTPRAQPILISSLGRTGSTWLIRLLSEHPQIIAHSGYPHEVRVGSYWMHALKVLSEPADPFGSIDPETFQGRLSVVGHNPYYYTGPIAHQDSGSQRSMNYWLGRAHVEQLVDTFQQSIDEYYAQLCRLNNRKCARYFVEKHPVSGHIPWMLWSLYSETREIFLVRNFRDMVSSMLAFNSKRGTGAFGRDRAESDEAFVRELGSDLRRLRGSWQSRADRAHLVRYEDLVSAPVDCLRRVLAYLNLEASASTVRDMVARASMPTPEMEYHRTTPNVAASIGRWTADLPAPLRAVCDEVVRESGKEFGYE